MEKLRIGPSGKPPKETKLYLSVGLRASVMRQVEEIAEKTNRSRSEVISILVDFALENCEF